jgi:hypothetical protein
MEVIVLPVNSWSDILSWAALLVGIVWLIYSAIITSHWIGYSFNPFISVISLVAYYAGSLILIGFMVSLIL